MKITRRRVRPHIRALRKFRKSHGDPATWGAVDCEVYQNLVMIALAVKEASVVSAFKRRARVLAAAAYATPLYVVAEVLFTGWGAAWEPLERHLDRVDDWLSDAEGACEEAGDIVFAEWVGDVTDRLTYAVGWMTARFARG